MQRDVPTVPLQFFYEKRINKKNMKGGDVKVSKSKDKGAKNTKKPSTKKPKKDKKK